MQNKVNEFGNWIGQHIWQFISRFRNKVYLEDVDAGTTTDVLVREADGEVRVVVGGGVGGVTQITANGGTSVGPPLDVSPSTGNVVLTSMAYDGGLNTGFVPGGGSASTFLRGDGTWVTPSGAGVTSVTGTLPIVSSGGTTPAISINTATSTTLGVVELGSDTDLTSTYITGGAGLDYRTYPIQLNAADQMGVSVPWTDTEYTAGIGLTLTGTVFDANVDGVQSVAATASSTTVARTYKVQVDASDNLVVNVPWLGSSNMMFHQHLKAYGKNADMSTSGNEYTMDAPSGNNEHKFGVDVGTSDISSIDPKDAVRGSIMVVQDDNSQLYRWNGWVYGTNGAAVTLRLYMIAPVCEGDDDALPVCKIAEDVTINMLGNSKPICFEAVPSEGECLANMDKGTLIVLTAELEGDGSMNFVVSTSLTLNN